jgi:hypothetical protein
LLVSSDDSAFSGSQEPNVKTDTDVLAQAGSIATYATNVPTPEISVWQLVFVNARIFFVGSDDVPGDAKAEAALSNTLSAGLYKSLSYRLF